MLSPLANVAGFYKLSLNNEVKVHKHYIFYYVLPISSGLRTGKNWEKKYYDLPDDCSVIHMLDKIVVLVK